MTETGDFYMNPKARGLGIFLSMLSGNIKLPMKGRKYVFYMYLMLFGSCTREMVPLLLGMADRAISHAARKLCICGDKGVRSRAVDDFISYGLRKGSIMRTVIKGRILYSLSSAGYRELSEFLSSPLMEYHTGRQGTWHQENMPRTAKNYSVHSSTVGIVFLQMAGKCRIGVGDFALDTPVGLHGSIRGKTFDQSPNRFRSDAHLLIRHPCRLEFFFENDMGTERGAAVVAKMERYFTFIFSTERSLDRSCVHFTIGDYHGDGDRQDIRIPGKNRMQVYRSCVSVLLSAAHVAGGDCPSEFGDVIALFNRIIAGSDTLGKEILSEITEYLLSVRSICPGFTDIYSYFDRERILKTVSAREGVRPGMPGKVTGRTYSARREKIFGWCRNAPDISMLVKRGLRITAGDNCSDGSDFIYSYPFLAMDGIGIYEQSVREHIKSYSYRGKYTDIADSRMICHNAEYSNIRFFQAGGTFYPFANCRVLHDVKGSFIYSFENISDDISARMRIERYLGEGAPDIPFLRIYVVYSDDAYSLEYVEGLKLGYSSVFNGREDISLLGL